MLLHTCKPLSCFYPPGLFHAQWSHLSRLKCKHHLWRTIPKSVSVSSVSSCSTLGIPSRQWPWAPAHADKLLLLSKSVFRWNHTIPVASSELRLKICIPRSWNSGFAPKSLLGTVRKGMGPRTKSTLRNELMHDDLQGQYYSRVAVFFQRRKKKKRFMELEGPSSCGCSMCHGVEIKNQRINRVCCVTKLKAFLSLYVCTHRKTYCTNETQLYVPSHIYCLLP